MRPTPLSTRLLPSDDPEAMSSQPARRREPEGPSRHHKPLVATGSSFVLPDDDIPEALLRRAEAAERRKDAALKHMLGKLEALSAVDAPATPEAKP